MPKNIENALIARTGRVLVAPKGTAVPLSIPTGPLVGFNELGYLNTSGITFNQETNELTTAFWQDDDQLRLASGGGWSADFEIAEWNEVTVPIIFGGEFDEDGVLYATNEFVELAMYIEIIRGTTVRGFSIPNAALTNKGSFSFVSTDKTVFPTTWAFNPSASMNNKPFAVIDPGFATVEG